MPAATKLSAAQAQAALDAIKARYAQYLTPQPYDAMPAMTIDGVEYPATPAGVDQPLYRAPELWADWDGHDWVVSWEEGPWEWAYRASMGGFNEVADQVAAMGGTPVEEEPIPMPDGVWCEPINSFQLGLYPA